MATENFTIDTDIDTKKLDMEGYHLSFLAPTRGPAQPTILDVERHFPGKRHWKWDMQEKYTVNDQNLEELRLAGWEMIDQTSHEILCLTSQCNLVLTLAQPERDEHVYWVRSKDVSHTKQYPVILAYEAEMEQEAPVIGLINLIPGTYAIVFEGDAAHYYGISQLGEAGTKLLGLIFVGVHYSSQRLLSVATKKNLSTIYATIQTHFAVAQMAASKLSELYWTLHQQTLAKQVRLPHSLMDIPPAFRHVNIYEKHGNLIPLTDGLEAIIRALTDAHDGAKHWGDHNKLPTYIHERTSSITAVTLHMNQLIPQQTDYAVAQQLWQRITTYSDNDGDVLLAMLAQVVAAGPDDKGGTWITSPAILDYRGILQKRHEIKPGVYRDAGHRPEDMQLISDSVGRLRDMHISVRSWREPKKPGGRRRKVTQESYLINITDFLTQGEEGQAKEGALQIAWYYRPGSCLDVPLRKNAKVAWLLQQTLRYDPYHEKWEKRLARYFMFQLRLNNSFGGTTIRRCIREILQEAGLSSSINQNDPVRTRERFEQAMRILTQHGHISAWSESEYLAAMEKHPTRGWLEMWLSQELEIIAAPLLEDLAQDILDQVHKPSIMAPKKKRKEKEEQ